MKLLLELKIENIFKTKDFVDPQSGEVKPSKWKIQTFDTREVENGEQRKLIDVSITDETYFKLKDSVGKTVTIPVGTWSTKTSSSVGYYGI